jgi:hypothetical protein
MFIQYEVWGIQDQHEELIECVPTLKEAEEIAEEECQFRDQVYILKDTDGDITEIKRYQGL